MALDNFTPEIWSAQLLVNLHNSLVYGGSAVVNRNYQGEIARFGDTVRINSIGGVNVEAYTKDTTFTSSRQILSSAQQSLVVDQAYKFDFEIDDIDMAQNNPTVMGEAMREAAFALGNQADGFLSGLINTAVDGTGNDLGARARTGGSATNLFENLVDLARVLDEDNAPAVGRWVVVSPLVFAELVKDARYTSFGTEANRATVASRAVGTVAGFNVLVSNQVPGAATTTHEILAGSTMATTFAEQINSVEAYRPHDRFADAMKGLHLYGAKVVRPSLLAKFSSTAT